MSVDPRAVWTADGHDRYVPAHHREPGIRLGHESRYEWFAEKWPVTGKRVVDFGCGSGYGSRMLADQASLVVGVDVSETAIEYAVTTYGDCSNVVFAAADLCRPLRDDRLQPGSFDLGISSEVLEHVDDPFAFLGNMASLLKPDGVALVGTPNRCWSRRQFGGRLVAASHVMEFTPALLQDVMHLFFDDVALYVHQFPASLIVPPEHVRPPLRRRGKAWLAGAGAKVLGDYRYGRLRETIRRSPPLATIEPMKYVRAAWDDVIFDHDSSVGLVCIGRRPTGFKPERH